VTGRAVNLERVWNQQSPEVLLWKTFWRPGLSRSDVQKYRLVTWNESSGSKCKCWPPTGELSWLCCLVHCRSQWSALQCARSWDRIALQAVAFIVKKTTVIYSLGHGLCAPFLQCLGQLSLLPYVGRWTSIGFRAE